MTLQLTSEQQAIIHHPTGHHARVLAVAGSGKTTTMAHRIRHLVVNQRVRPSKIRVLMFNRLARQQFQQHLSNIDAPASLQGEVHTFHSFAHQLISATVTKGLLPEPAEWWLDDKMELIRITVKRAIGNLEKRDQIPAGEVEADEALEAISLWKGSLIPPNCAGHRTNIHIPKVYQEFEDQRCQAEALTYDDFVPLAVGILESDSTAFQEWCNRATHVIVDEYQDVNYGQQRLVELLSGERADVMVVGDDDQTIYEWRGARPEYILSEFRAVFANKPHEDYTLSRSFRFGPVIAQAAANTIRFNTRRVQKRLVADNVGQLAKFDLLENPPEEQTDTNREMAGQIVALVTGEEVEPQRIVVLARMYAQMNGLQSVCLANGIPFRVVGQKPFFHRPEIRKLLDYIRLASVLNQVPTPDMEAWLLSVANTPSRRLTRKTLSRAIGAAYTKDWSLGEALSYLCKDIESPFSAFQRERLSDLLAFLHRLRERVRGEPQLEAGHLLKWMVDSLDYLAHFDDYYGEGEESYERKQTVEYFLSYARSVHLSPLGLLSHIDSIDTTRGVPAEQQIVMTTVFKTKGLEYDYVFIPECEEGFMPCLYATDNSIYDTSGGVREPQPSEAIENERRLFYVAITRARAGVCISTSAPIGSRSAGGSGNRQPSRFLDEIQLPATANVMTPLQQLASGDRAARPRLLKNVSRFGGVRSLMEGLVQGYLEHIGDDSLTEDVLNVIDKTQEVPFAYRSEYSLPKARQKRRGSEPGKLHRAWDEIPL